MKIHKDALKFKSIGENVRISEMCRIYNPESLEIGDNVRIDDFCVLSCGSGLKIGSHVHIACYSIFYAKAGITLEDFSEFAVRTTVLTATDDFHGHSLVGPCIPDKFKPRLKAAPVRIGRHALLGAGCVIMPGVRIGEGASIGTFSFVKGNCDPWTIYAGVPAKIVGKRDRKMLDLERQFLEEYGNRGS